MTIPHQVSTAVQHVQVWLKELRDNAGLVDESEAYSVLRVVLHQLRDRLTSHEAVDLAAQLPVIVRGVYFDGWRPGKEPSDIRDRQGFLDAVTLALLPNRLPPEPIVGQVFSLLAHHCDPGEIADVIGQLPADIKELWPESARTFRERMAR
jgi:uncharacterized protein (DUF2267 family)